MEIVARDKSTIELWFVTDVVNSLAQSTKLQNIWVLPVKTAKKSREPEVDEETANYYPQHHAQVSMMQNLYWEKW